MDLITFANKVKKSLNMISGFEAQSLSNLPLRAIILMICVSLFSSLFLSYLYLRFYENRATGSQVYRAFPLLGIAITGIFICIQFSLPLSLGLLGALSIVRFRTPIKEPEEIGFIMLVVASSIACATFNFVIMATILIIAVAALMALKYGLKIINKSDSYGMIIFTLPTDEYIQNCGTIEDLMKEGLSNIKIQSINNDEMISTVRYSFNGIKTETWRSIESKLNEHINPKSLNIFFGRHEVI
jgi:hypothetical protein